MCWDSLRAFNKMKVCLVRKHFSKIMTDRCLVTNASSWVEPTGYSTGISVYNSASKCKVPLVLRNTNYASWYMCGPTVYDSAHIGHACCYVKFDIIRRILVNFFDINVVLVMGITDIDDKIIARALDLKEDVKAVSNRYENEFFADMSNLNILLPTVTVRVTDVIPHIVDFVKTILKNGLAYQAGDGSIYFDTVLYKDYGKLCAATAIQDTNSVMPHKRSSQDFALWKAAKPGEPFWHSPWGNGRPGWHIECSTIASTVLGSIIDLHSGGVDLLFPHHENEEAQSCAYHNVKQWVNYWLHTGHLHLKGDEKMSKSLKNTISVQELLSLHSSDHFRMYCLLSQYRNKIEYTDEALENAKAICRKIESFLFDCDSYIKGISCNGNVSEQELVEKMSFVKHSFQFALADDFDTAKAMGLLMNFISETNSMLRESTGHFASSRSPGAVAAASSFVQEVTGKLGLQFSKQKTFIQDKIYVTSIMDPVINFRSEVRQMALRTLKSKQKVLGEESSSRLLKACDQLRDSFSTVGIEIKDHGEQSSWHMKHNIEDRTVGKI